MTGMSEIRGEYFPRLRRFRPRTAMPHAAGLWPALAQKIADGSRSVRGEVEEKVAAALGIEIARLGKTAQRLAEIHERILAARAT